MSLNTKQKSAIVAVVGGMSSLVYAGYGMITNPNTGEVTKVQDNTTQRPISYDGLTNRDIPANDSMGQYIANSSNTNNTPSSASCEYYGEAGKLGIYHFSFPEVPTSDLVTVNGYKVNKMAENDLRDMIADARSQGVTLTIGSAFRSEDYQRGIVQRKKTAGQSAKQIYFVSSHPGYSEHHTGLAIDFTPINHGFAKTAGYGWLKNNAHKYGFEQTFTSQYSQATGVSQESWHWKFTGSPQAKAMLANSQCYLKPKTDWHAS